MNTFNEYHTINCKVNGQRYKLKFREVAQDGSDGPDTFLKFPCVYAMYHDTPIKILQPLHIYGELPFIVKDKKSGKYILIHGYTRTTYEVACTTVYVLRKVDETTAQLESLSGKIVSSDTFTVSWELLETEQTSWLAAEVIKATGCFEHRLSPSTAKVMSRECDDVLTLKMVRPWFYGSKSNDYCYELTSQDGKDVPENIKPCKSSFEKIFELLPGERTGLFATELKDISGITLSYLVKHNSGTFAPVILKKCYKHNFYNFYYHYFYFRLHCKFLFRSNYEWSQDMVDLVPMENNYGWSDVDETCL